MEKILKYELFADMFSSHSNIEIENKTYSLGISRRAYSIDLG